MKGVQPAQLHNWERGCILVAFSGNCGYSLITNLNVIGGSFLKVSCSLQYEIMWFKFLACYIGLYWVVLHFEWVFCPCLILLHHTLIIWEILVHCFVEPSAF